MGEKKTNLKKRHTVTIFGPMKKKRLWRCVRICFRQNGMQINHSVNKQSENFYKWSWFNDGNEIKQRDFIMCIKFRKQIL